MKRTALIKRTTRETDITVKLNLDGQGRASSDTTIGFLDHMLQTLAKHGAFDLCIRARGDRHVDQHHLIEDVGIVLGQAFDRALGLRRGINRAGYFIQPMDEALAMVAVDIAGRPHLNFDARFRRRFCGELDTDLLEDLFAGLANNLKANIAVKVLSGRSDHHKIEAIFKALARAMRTACGRDRRMLKDLPSVKGLLS